MFALGPRACVRVCLGDFKCDTYCASVCVSAAHLKAECYSFFLQLTRAHLIAVLWEAIELPLELNQAKHTDAHVHTILLNERRFPLSFVPLPHLHLLLPAPHPPASSVKAFGLNSLSSSSSVSHIVSCDVDKPLFLFLFPLSQMLNPNLSSLSPSFVQLLPACRASHMCIIRSTDDK